MRKLLALLPVLICLQQAGAQKKIFFPHTILSYFTEIKEASKKGSHIWDADIYGAVLLVNPVTRFVYANEQDTAGILKKEGKIFSGTLPGAINIANTAIDWGGKRWAMVMLPLPANKKNRINLLAHELFHKLQPELNFKFQEKDNAHLDTKDGRIYLRLELEALKKAVNATTATTAKKNISDALAFRKYRQTVFAGAATAENMLELNEGIAEYTGLMISNRNKKETQDHFKNNLAEFLNNQTFVRSFAYHTIPMYGYLLQQKQKAWHKNISLQTNLTDYFMKAFGVQFDDELLKTYVDASSNQYNSAAIIKQETEREERRKKLVAEYKNKFIESPHFVLHFQQMQISFDPGNIMPLEEKGTVYPNIRVSDKWGILEVTNGALISSNWDKIIVTTPLVINNKNISGDGWKLNLNDGYTIMKDESSGNYQLKKQ